MKKIDLTTKETTYTYYISENYQQITKLFNDKSIDLNTFKSEVKKIVEPANITNSKINFLNTVERQTNKNSLYFYISNSMLSGCHLMSDPNSKWKSEK